MTEDGARVERDSMGEVRVPQTAFYGASTERARQNFPISNLRMPRRFIRALAQVKDAAALVNTELGLMEARLANAIQQAAEEVEEGKFDKDFVVDVFQTGSGTSTNTNANEVIANRANEILGQPLGSRQPVHPNDHVNKCQSSNDVIPSAMQLAALVAIHERPLPAQATLDTVLSTAGALRTVAVSLWKIGNDLRWFASGPRAGLGEITLPEVQPGSSIMPGKVNPVIIESMTMVVAKVLGNDQTIAIAAQSGSIFELNLMMPVAAYALLESIALLSASAQNFARQSIAGIKSTERGPQMVEQGLMLATALAPAIGYDAAAKIAKEALNTGKTIREVAREQTRLAPEELHRLLDPLRMTQPGVEAGPAGG